MNRITLTAVSAALALSALAAADFSHVEVRDVSKEIGTPAGLRTWRIYAMFTGADENVRAVFGDSDAPLVFETNDPVGLFNDGGVFAGLKQEDFAAYPLAPLWDSWVTIDRTMFAGNNTNYSPGFLNNDGVTSVVFGTSWSDDNDGWFNSKGGHQIFGPEVLIAQFTVGLPYGVHLSGSVAYLSPDGVVESKFFCVSSSGFSTGVTCPADIDDSGAVDSQDLMLVLSSWGTCVGECPADIDGNGTVEFPDLLAVLFAWGPCPQPGACCFPDGSCFEACTPDGAGCTAMGGVYQGVDMLCADVSCPHPGACCMTDGTCDLTGLIGGPACAAMGGAYQGDDTTCMTIDCAEANACCFDTGVCTALVESACLAQGGAYQGEGFACADVTCPVGACCGPDLFCTVVSEPDCLALGGNYLGGPCFDCAVGACCFDDGTCTDLPVEQCINIGGAFQGDGTSCDTTTCPLGACCFPDFTCAIFLERLCLDAGGSFVGENTICNIDCSRGACCLPDGTCVFVTPATCDVLDGVYAGAGIPCESVKCP